MNLPKTTRGQETLEKICKASEKLFSEKGFYKTSITEITKEADVAPGTFYIYFNDKLAVFRFLIEEISSALRKELAAAVHNCKTRYEAEYEGFKIFFSFISRHRGLYNIVWQAQFVDPELFKEYYEKIARSYVMSVKKAQEDGEIKDLDPEGLVYCFIGITNFLGLKWVIWENKPVPEEVFEDVMEFIKNGAFKY